MIDTQDEDEEFEALLKKFIEEGCEEVKPDDEDEDEDEDEDLDYHLEDDENDDDDEDDEQISTIGELEVNPNNCVKVEILQPIKHPERELEKLVGCQDIKKRIDELITMNRYNIRMHAMNPKVKVHALSLHSIFLGRPGTGKTTVCKIMGSLLHKAQMLSKGHVVVAGRGTFVGTNWGDEERAVRQVVEMAKGGVLMIDEAYLLNSDNKNDPGKMVIPLLMEILANEKQRDLAIVLCGYKQPMLRLLELNPGLESRFPNRFEFRDFSVDELLDITQRRISEYNYTFTPSAWSQYKLMITEAYTARDPQTWGNARFIANQLERIYIRHATRCVSLQPKDKRELLLLTPEDIMPMEVPRQKAQIGFH